MNAYFFLFVTLSFVSWCEGVTIQLRSPIEVGEQLTVTCTSESGLGGLITLLINGQSSGLVGTVSGSESRFAIGTVSASNDGDIYRCVDALDDTQTDSSPLVVWSSPMYSPPFKKVSANLIGGSALVQFALDAKPTVNESDVTLTNDGMEVNDRRINFNSTTVIFTNVNCSDAGNYTLLSTNSAGSGNATFEIVIESPPVWQINSRVSFNNQFNPSKYLRVCPDEDLEVSCVFYNISITVIRNDTMSFDNGTETFNFADGNASISLDNGELRIAFGNSLVNTAVRFNGQNIEFDLSDDVHITAPFNVKDVIAGRADAECRATNQFGTAESGVFTITYVPDGGRSHMGVSLFLLVVMILLSRLLSF